MTRIQAGLLYVAIGATAIAGAGTARAADAQSALKYDLYAAQATGGDPAA